MERTYLSLRTAVFFVLVAFGKADLTVGTDFVLAFPCFLSTVFTPSLIVSNPNADSARVTIYSAVANFTTVQQTVGAQSGLQIVLSTDRNVLKAMATCNNNVIARKGFRVQSSVPIMLYGYIADAVGEDATQFLVLPTKMLASQYVASGGTFDPFNFFGIIVSQQTGTTVTVGNATVTLDELDVYSPIAATASAAANRPFAYFLTLSSNIAMALPKTYASTTIPIPPAVFNGSMNCQIFAFNENTQVSINKGVNINVDVAEPLQITLDGTNANLVTASQPVQVLGYQSRGMMSLLQYASVPETFVSTSVQFYTLPTNPKYPATLTITVPLQSTGNIQLDGQGISALQYKRIPNSGYYYHTQVINGPAQLHVISTTAANDLFMANVFYNSGTRAYSIAMNLTVSA